MLATMSAPAKPYIGRTGSEFTRAGLLLAAVVAATVAVVDLVRAVASPGATLAVTLAEGTRTPSLDGLPAGTSVDLLAETVELSVDTLPLGLRLFAAAGPALLLLSVAAGAWCLAGLVHSVRDGRPFDRRNPARLAGAAVAVLAGGLLAPVVRDLAGIAVLEHTDLVGPGSPFAVAASLSFAPVLGAVLLLTVAEAFRRGAALSDEVEGMV